jgi:multicomponent Na+:H+ antiporter subunit D
MARFYLLAALAVIASIITLASFMKFQRYAFRNQDQEEKRGKVKEVPFPMVFSMVIMALMCILLSLLVIPSLREDILAPAIDVLLNPGNYSSAILGI